jgi:hypothetical protein
MRSSKSWSDGLKADSRRDDMIQAPPALLEGRGSSYCRVLRRAIRSQRVVRRLAYMSGWRCDWPVFRDSSRCVAVSRIYTTRITEPLNSCPTLVSAALRRLVAVPTVGR